MASFHAEAQRAPVLIERGRDFERWDLNNGQQKIVAGAAPWVFDPAQGKYVPHIVRFVNSTYTEVQSGMVGVKIGKFDAIITDVNMTKNLAYERWLPKVDTTTIEKFWIDRTVVANETGVFITNIYQATIGPKTVTAYMTYAVYDGAPMIRIVKIEGLPQSLVSKLKFDREWRTLDADALEFDGVVNSISSTVKTSLQDGTGQYVKVLKNGEFVMQELLQRAKDNIIKIDYDRNRVVFTYGGWTDASNIMLVDDVFSEPNPTEDGYIRVGPATGTACPSNSYSKVTNAEDIGVFYGNKDISNFCERGYVEWNIASIPDGSDVTNTVFKFEVDERQNPVNCDITPITNRPSSTTASTLYTDIGDGTAYVSNNNFCTTLGTNKQLDLGTAADTDVEGKLTSDWFAIGYKATTETRGLNDIYMRIASEERTTPSTPTPKPTLEITYTPATVTVPIQFNFRAGSDTMETAGVSATISCTGGGGTHDGNPASQSFTCNASTTVTVTMPTDAATSRFRFSDGTTQKTFTSCASGTCTTTTYSDVTRQFKQTVDLVAVPADMPAVVTVTRTIVGSSGTQEVDEVSVDIWPDQGSTISIEDPVSISATERWDTTGTVSWSVDQSRTISNTYYQQWQPTITATSIPASVTSVTVTRTQLGSQGTQDIAGSTATGIWADHNTLISVEDPVSISATERWDTSGTVSWTQIDATNRATGTYFKQWLQTVDLMGVPADMPASVTVTRTILGSSGTQEVDETSTAIWADDASTISIEDPVSITANERWDTSGTISWTVDQGRTIGNTYYQQFQNTYAASTNGAGPPTWDTGLSVTPTGTVLGSGSTNICTISPSAGTTTTASCSGWADTNTAVNFASTMSGAGTNIRWMASGTTSFTDTTGGNTRTVTYYKQLQNTYAASTNGNGPPTWDSGLSVAATGTHLGTGSTSLCTISPTASTTTTASCTAYADYNTAASVASTMTGAGANIRWMASGTISWTQTTGGNTNTATYYKQLQNTYQASPAGQRTTYDAAMTISITGTHLGTANSNLCNISTINGGGAASCTAYGDYNLAASFDTTETVSATERWVASGTTSFTQITGGNTNNVNYYNQFGPTVTATGISASVTSVTVTRTQLGSSGTEDIAGGTATTVWIDYNTIVSVEDPVSISADERWDTAGTVSWTQTDATNRATGTYTKQWRQAMALTGLDAQTVTVTRTILGVSGTQAVGTSAVDIWADDATTLTLEDPKSISATERYDTGGTTVYTVNVGRTISNTYYHQWQQTVTASGITNTVTSVTVTRTQLGASNTEDIAGSTATGIWVDHNTALSIEDPVSISATERWDTSGTVSWSALTSAQTLTSGTYYRQWLTTVDIAAVPADMPAVVTVTRTILAVSGTQEVDETSTQIWIDHSSTMTLEDPVSISATERWDTGGTTSYLITSAQTASPTYYQQFQPTVTATGISASVTTVTVTRTQLGSQGTQDIAGSTATGIWADYNTLISVEDPVSISATERWDTSGTVSWTQIDATNRATDTYFRQWKQDIDLAGLTGVNTITVTRTILGASGTQEINNNPVTIWADHSSNLSLEDPLIVTANEERFDTGDTVSFTVDQGRSITATYYRQWNPDITATGVSDSVQLQVTRTQLGGSGTENINGGTSTGVWVDDNTVLSLENPKTISATEQWITPGTRSWTITDALAKASGTYYRQWKPTVTLSGLDAQSITVTRTVNGSATTPTQGNGAVSYWIDHGTSWSTTNPKTISSTEQYMSTDTTSWTQTDATGRTVAYRHQFKPTLTLSGLDAQTVTVTRTVNGTSGVTASQGNGGTSYWLDVGATFSVQNPKTLSATEQYMSTGTTSWTQNDATNRSVSYSHQWKPTLTLSGLDAQTVTVTRTVNGSSANPPTQGNGAVSYWIDHGTTLSVENPKTLTATEQYISTDAYSFTITDAASRSVSYRHQFKATLTLSGLDAQVVMVTRTVNGSSTTPSQTIGAASYWIDAGTIWSVENPKSVSATERYMSTGTTSWVQSDATARSVSYLHQWRPTITLSGLDSQTVAVSYTINGTSQQPLQGTGSTAYWIDHGTAVSFTNPKTISASEQYIHTGAVSSTVTSASTISRTYYHQWKPTVTLAGLDSQTITITRTVNGTAGTTANQGTGSTSYWTDHGTTLTLEDPKTISSIERYDTGSTTSYLITSASNASATYYRQFKQTVTLSGIDAIRSISVTRTQLGASGTSSVSGSTATEIWADNGSSFSVPDVLVVVADENRFKSYNSTAQLTYTISSGGPKTYVYQHEFNMLFRVYEKHLGPLFAPMPAASFTGTIQTANGTQLSLTFNSQATDDYLQPAGGRTWVPNGTASWTNITWRGLTVNATGSAAISAYGNFDIKSSSKHYGFPGDRHIRIAVDGVSAIDEGAVFDSDTTTLRFNATAEGQRTAVIEFTTISFDDVSEVKVDGVALATSSWSVTKPGNDIGLLTITGIAFSERAIEVKFVLAPGSSTTGGTAGGGVSFPSLQLPPFLQPEGGQSPSLGLDVNIDPVRVDPGTSADFTIRISWTGAAIITITNIDFTSNSQWFTILQELPATASMPLEAGANILQVDVPVRVTVPPDAQGIEVRVPVKIVAYANGIVAEQERSVILQLGSSPNLVLILAGVFGSVTVAGVIGAAYKNKGNGRGGTKYHKPSSFGSRNYNRKLRLRRRY